MIRALLGLAATLMICVAFTGCDSGGGGSTTAAERAEHEKPGGRPAPTPEKPPGADLAAGQQTGSK